MVPSSLSSGTGESVSSPIQSKVSGTSLRAGLPAGGHIRALLRHLSAEFEGLAAENARFRAAVDASTVLQLSAEPILCAEDRAAATDVLLREMGAEDMSESDVPDERLASCSDMGSLKTSFVSGAQSSQSEVN